MYSRTVAGRDSARCAAAASRASMACADSDVTWSLDCPQLPIVSGPRRPRLAPLLFWFCRFPSQLSDRRYEPRREKFSDDPGRFPQSHGRRPAPFLAIAEIPAARIYGRYGPGDRLLALSLPPRENAERTRARPLVRRPDRLLRSRPRMRPPE